MSAIVIPYNKDNKMIKTVSDLLLSLKSREQELLKQYDIVKHPGIIGDMYEGLTKEVLSKSVFEGLNIQIRAGKIKNSKNEFSGEIDCMIVVGEGESIPYTDKTFDVVIANHMLYHVPDRKKALAEIWRVLKDKGVLFAATVGNTHLQELYEWISRVEGGEPGRFKLEFTLENGREQLQEYFPSVELSRYQDSLRVTDVDLIKAYIRSMTSAADLQDNQFQLIEKELDEIIRENGEIHIKKDTGLFKALK